MAGMGKKQGNTGILKLNNMTPRTRKYMKVRDGRRKVARLISQIKYVTQSFKQLQDAAHTAQAEIQQFTLKTT